MGGRFRGPTGALSMSDTGALARGGDEKLDLYSSVPFFACHLIALIGPFFVGVSWKLVALAVGLYYFRMAGTTIGYHRYASHRAFQTSRALQFIPPSRRHTTAQ